MTQRTKSRIACIGWGSLIWNPGDLPLYGNWENDGPDLPVEFGRESSGRRITLVVCDDVKRVRTFWVLLNSTNVRDASRLPS
jgi:hypothetical protein